jgi:predicted lysophospholipase L1 biosynthesis ABC-type transport system permease subunit
MKMSTAVEEPLRQVTGLPVSQIRAMDEVVSRSTSRERFHMLLMSVFGSVALLLAAIGIYGLMAYSVEQRTHEIGIRMALGAERGNVRGMIMRQGMIFAAAGIVIGIGGAFALTKQIASFLFGVTAFDPLVFGTIPLVLVATTAIAVRWPALQATKVDPQPRCDRADYPSSPRQRALPGVLQTARRVVRLALALKICRGNGKLHLRVQEIEVAKARPPSARHTSPAVPKIKRASLRTVRVARKARSAATFRSRMCSM